MTEIKTPSVLLAALMGDIEKGTPAGILRSEKEGQGDVVNKDILPRTIGMNGDSKPALEAMGIQVDHIIDDLFYGVKMPEGWHKEPTEHSMWSTLIDDKGQQRAEIFYKAAFYDRRAFIRFNDKE